LKPSMCASVSEKLQVAGTACSWDVCAATQNV